MLLARVRNDAVLTLIKQSGKHTKLLPANDASAEGLATDSAGKWGVWQHALGAAEAITGPAG